MKIDFQVNTLLLLWLYFLYWLIWVFLISKNDLEKNSLHVSLQKWPQCFPSVNRQMWSRGIVREPQKRSRWSVSSKRAIAKHRCASQAQSQYKSQTCSTASARHLAKLARARQTCRLAKATARHTANSRKAITMKPPVANTTAIILVSHDDGNQSKKVELWIELDNQPICWPCCPVEDKKHVCTNFRYKKLGLFF